MTDVPNIVTQEELVENLADLIEAVSTEWEVDFRAEGMRIGPKADYIANAILVQFNVLRHAAVAIGPEHTPWNPGTGQVSAQTGTTSWNASALHPAPVADASIEQCDGDCDSIFCSKRMLAQPTEQVTLDPKDTNNDR